jgi:hypothetical protein
VIVNGECSQTGKVRFATARAAYQAVQQVYWGRRTKTQPRRVYYCMGCQGYHLSSKGDVWGRRRRLFQTIQRVRLNETDTPDTLG